MFLPQIWLYPIYWDYTGEMCFKKKLNNFDHSRILVRSCYIKPCHGNHSYAYTHSNGLISV